MLKIGITGGIGSGKTTVSKIFETLGIPVFYADQVAKDIMVTDVELISGIKARFGADSYLADGSLHRKHIADIVFKNEYELHQLNALVHPAVFRAFENWVSNRVSDNTPYVLKEAALLFESGSYKQCDKTILVTSTLHLKTQRVMSRDRVAAHEVKTRMDKQFTDEQKEKMADYFIRNDETHSLILQVLTFHDLFLTHAAS